jgi:hypothetical protein
MGHLTPFGAANCPTCGAEVAEPGDAKLAAPSDQRPVTPQQRISFLASGLRRAADFLEMASAIVAVIGVVGGFVLGIQTSEDGYDTTRPYIALGLVVAASSIFGGIFNWCLARAMHLFAEHTAIVHSIDLQAEH